MAVARITLLRGLPGSGKTTWAEARESAVICSADQHQVVDGAYRYDPAKVQEAHDQCFREFLGHVDAVVNAELPFATEENPVEIVVDNTNVTAVELAPYVRIAQVCKIPYRILYFPCDVQTAARRNIHGVPHGTLLYKQRMLLTEVLPPGWVQEIYLDGDAARLDRIRELTLSGLQQADAAEAELAVADHGD